MGRVFHMGRGNVTRAQQNKNKKEKKEGKRAFTTRIKQNVFLYI